MDEIRLSISDSMNGEQVTAWVPVTRSLWDQADEAGREEWRTIARHRFGHYVFMDRGVKLSSDHLDALPVTVEDPVVS